MKTKGKKHILLAIPCESNEVHVPVASFAVEAMRQNGIKDCPYEFSIAFQVGRKPTEFARNCLITQAYNRKDCDAIWFVDSDMVPSKNSFELLNCKDDIVAGIAPILSNPLSTEPSFTFNLYKRVQSNNNLDFIPIGLNGGVPFKVDGAGTACMVIDRKVFSDKRLWLGKPSGKEKIIPLFRWPRSITGETLGTDDLDFCRRARDLGYTITVNPNIIWGHLKEMDLMWPMEKLRTVLMRPPSSLITMNEWNDHAIRAGQNPHYVYQNCSPSGEATGNSSQDGVNRTHRKQVTGVSKEGQAHA